MKKRQEIFITGRLELRIETETPERKDYRVVESEMINQGVEAMGLERLGNLGKLKGEPETRLLIRPSNGPPDAPFAEIRGTDAELVQLLLHKIVPHPHARLY